MHSMSQWLRGSRMGRWLCPGDTATPPHQQPPHQQAAGDATDDDMSGDETSGSAVPTPSQSGYASDTDTDMEPQQSAIAADSTTGAAAASTEGLASSVSSASAASSGTSGSPASSVSSSDVGFVTMPRLSPSLMSQDMQVLFAGAKPAKDQKPSLWAILAPAGVPDKGRCPYAVIYGRMNQKLTLTKLRVPAQADPQAHFKKAIANKRREGYVEAAEVLAIMEQHIQDTAPYSQLQQYELQGPLSN